MKAYKAFNKDMTCRGFQFEEGKEYHENKAELCRSGFHACLNPLDCWNYYDILDSEIHEVELDEVSSERNIDTKVCGKKIKIGAKLSLTSIINAFIDFVNNNENDKVDGAWARYTRIASSGNSAQLASSGGFSQIASSGNHSRIASSGGFSQLAISGDRAQLASFGYRSRLAISGECTFVVSSGDCAQLASSGDSATIKSTGENSVIVCSGYNNKVSAVKGSWITLTEWKENKEGTFIPVCVKTEQVDGVRIKENVFYTIKDGEFVEVEED